jgi:arylsulfatase
MPGYDYTFLGLERFSILAQDKLKPGKSTIRFVFDYDGGGLAKGGNGTLYINDRKVAEGRIERTQPMIFSADETADVGIDLATPVVETIGAEAESRFTGTIHKVTVEVGPMTPATPPAKQTEIEQMQRHLALRRALAE